MIKTLTFVRPNVCKCSQNMIPVVYEAYSKFKDRYSLSVINIDQRPDLMPDCAAGDCPIYIISYMGVEQSRTNGEKTAEELSAWLESN
jgi:hypothetical protein